MKKGCKRGREDQGITLLLSIIAVFAVFGIVVFSVARKTSAEMSASAIQNLSESLNLIKSTIESSLKKDAQFQRLMAREIATIENPEDYIHSFQKNQTMVRLSFVRAGEPSGVSSVGDVFLEEELDFTGGNTIEGLPVSRSYINYMGTWAYTMECPVEKDGQKIGALYVEYVYDSLDKSLPDGFYNQKAMLYVMDAESERFVLKPKGMGERNAGHLNLEDFYRANDIRDQELKEEVLDCVKDGRDILFYHDIRGKKSLNYMWAMNGGSLYLTGYVPIEAIQQEGKTVNQNILIVVVVMLSAFLLCCVLYYFSQRQQEKVRKEREAERELHNKQLAEALQAAQIASNSKTTFLSNMSHDIRTPMNAVLGFATLLARDADSPDKVREYTKKIQASGQHLLGLINDVLDVSKIESGKVVLTVEEFTLNDLVSSVDAIIRPMAAAKSQEFHVEVTGIRHEYLLGDETRVSQILINLLSNAVKYTPAGGNIWLRMTGMKQRSTQYERIRIEVEDDGYGMTQEYLKVIFDAFTRAENSTTNKVQGTGLGMAITKSIVELMGGTIDVTSEVDKGSLFKVELELRIPEGQVDRKFWETCGISRMLMVGSNRESCKNIQEMMLDVGIQVDLASGIEKAVHQIQGDTEAGRYQLVLADWGEQGMCGRKMAEKIREAVPDTIPVLFLVSHDTNIPDETEAEAKAAQAGILVKPFFVSALREKLQEIQTRQENDPVLEQGESGLEGLHFLAAEDNEINAEILGELLQMEGATCEIVENGQLALERFLQEMPGTFDAILMDVQMPVMNGYDAARAIRASAREDAGTIPVIAMTANAFAEDEKEALAAGMDVHLAKPIDVGLLKKIIYQYVRK